MSEDSPLSTSSSVEARRAFGDVGSSPWRNLVHYEYGFDLIDNLNHLVTFLFRPAVSSCLKAMAIFRNNKAVLSIVLG